MSKHEIVSTFDVEDAYVARQVPMSLAEEDAPRAAFQTWLREIRARAWEEGAKWAAVEAGAIENERIPWLVPEDNPYREA